MLYPDLLGNQASIVGIREKQEEVTQLTQDVKLFERDLTDIASNVIQVEEQMVPLKREAEDIRKQIAGTEFGMHMPSVLIFIEQNAYANDLDLTIMYDEIQSVQGGGPRPQEMTPEQQQAHPGTNPENPEVSDDQGEPNESDETEQTEEDAPESEPEEEETPELPSPEGEEDNSEDLGQGGPVEDNPADAETEESIQPEAPQGPAERVRISLDEIRMIPGVGVTNIPMRVEGTYSEIRAFLVELDEIDFLEPYVVDLSSNGNQLSGVISFNVYHIESGGGSY